MNHKPEGFMKLEQTRQRLGLATAECTVEVLGKLKLVFYAQGTVTAGNSSPMNDGTAAVVVMSR